jgi:hypothetical protein
MINETLNYILYELVHDFEASDVSISDAQALKKPDATSGVSIPVSSSKKNILLNKFLYVVRGLKRTKCKLYPVRVLYGINSIQI